MKSDEIDENALVRVDSDSHSQEEEEIDPEDFFEALS
jgi:hypothetical protein